MGLSHNEGNEKPQKPQQQQTVAFEEGFAIPLAPERRNEIQELQAYITNIISVSNFRPDRRRDYAIPVDSSGRLVKAQDGAPSYEVALFATPDQNFRISFLELGIPHGTLNANAAEYLARTVQAAFPHLPVVIRAVPRSDLHVKLLGPKESIQIPLKEESLPIEIILSPNIRDSRAFEVLRTESGQWVLRNKMDNTNLIHLPEGREIHLGRGLVPNMSRCISRTHAKLEVKEGHLIVSDTNSTFGTEVHFYAPRSK
jgi:hypothetical protein